MTSTYYDNEIHECEMGYGDYASYSEAHRSIILRSLKLRKEFSDKGINASQDAYNYAKEKVMVSPLFGRK